MKTKPKILQTGGASVLASLLLLCISAHAQIVTGSNGSNGALDYSSITYATNIVINMADHPTGIYQYTYVNIPNNVTVSFIPNANNTPVYWLVQGSVIVDGTVNLSGQSADGPQGAAGGPGGYQGGEGGGGQISGSSGQGPGAGMGGTNNAYGGTYNYGNQFLIPLLGGSGGGGAVNGGGGGGGALLIAAASSITLNGTISANGGSGFGVEEGPGSGGAVRLVAAQIFGKGTISTAGGIEQGELNKTGGFGRIRLDTYDNQFNGSHSYSQFTSGSQFVIIPTAGQLPQLTITTIGGVPVSPSPTGKLYTPDAVLSAQQNNPIPIVVSCVNLPLDSLITVSVMPSNGASVSGTGYNNTGTLASSTATISINIPRGGGLVYATATTGN